MREYCRFQCPECATVFSGIVGEPLQQLCPNCHIEGTFIKHLLWAPKKFEYVIIPDPTAPGGRYAKKPEVVAVVLSEPWQPDQWVRVAVI